MKLSERLTGSKRNPLRLTREVLLEVSDFRRENCPLSALTLGVKCGTSDATSNRACQAKRFAQHVVRAANIGEVNDSEWLAGFSGFFFKTLRTHVFVGRTRAGLNRQQDDTAFDQLIRAGGTAFFSETTEIIGAEDLVAKRAVNESVAKK